MEEDKSNETNKITKITKTNKTSQSEDINITCVCGTMMTENNELKSVIAPCQHLIHSNCKSLLRKSCFVCGVGIRAVYPENRIRKDPVRYGQTTIDIDSLTTGMVPSPTLFDRFNFIYRMNILFDLYRDLIMSSTRKHRINVSKKILKFLNIKVRVKGYKNLQHGKKCIYISNHTSYIDSLCTFPIIDTAYLGAHKMLSGSFINPIISKISHVKVKRGVSKNTIDNIKTIVDKKGSILIYPEGTICCGPYLFKFRSGAFITGYPVQPMSARPNIYLNCSTFSSFLNCLMMNKDFEYTVNILPLEYPPFTKEKIESIRQKMADVSDLQLSRISSRTIID